MTSTIIEPTHITALSTAERYELAGESAAFTKRTGYQVLDPCGYVACDELAARVRASAQVPSAARDAAVRCVDAALMPRDRLDTDVVSAQPLHLSSLSAAELLRFVEIVDACDDRGRPAPLDPDGFISDDVIAQWVKASS